MDRDITSTELYREAKALCVKLRRPGTGQMSDAAEVNASPDGRQAAFAGTLLDSLEGSPITRVAVTDLSGGSARILTYGPNTDRFPRFSPNGHVIAFLSDRGKAGNFQLYLLDPEGGAVRDAASVDGWVEYLQWSPDGNRILLGVAAHGADVAGAQGAIISKQAGEGLPVWMPTVETADESDRCRSIWVYELASRHVRQVSTGNSNVWEAVWCGNEAVAAVMSPSPREGSWYSACLHTIDLRTGECHLVYRPRAQFGCISASPSGENLAVVEGLSSDRGVVAGELRLIETASGSVQNVDLQTIDVAYTEWHSDRELLLSGHQGFCTVVGVLDSRSGVFTETWRSQDISTNGRYANVSGLNAKGDCVLVGEGFRRAPEIGLIRDGKYRTVQSFDLGYGDAAKAIDAVQPMTWKAPDELEIQGWFLRPKGDGPYPLVMLVHGGPVGHWRPMWLGRRALHVLLLVMHGYAVFLPNPRGSSGRGQSFVRRVQGDLGGADAQDLLSGLDLLSKGGLVDPKRLGVTGTSYGGFMTSWLIAQDDRFSAAVVVAPHTNQVTERLLSNIPHFLDLFLADKHTNPGGKYFSRSPIMYAHRVRTPTLNICGALDRCTPPEEAAQFHNALLENGVKSVLLIYPEEGHGVRRFPAAIDYAGRVVAWFEEHMPATSAK